ncbi:glycoside hydrolase family 2 TIM barrel-domain containing protein [Rubrivirga sp. S365]|uniref:glycoside hydrolase family 2 TIM barrel-domain containing protein n=1 Tax=Rubrivirga sp. S365 TaxID=3076080 RepID=UPI0028C6111D|nr:glycoside hydrolase family 2 TIM barrel-domain containing protein [Rubrivirga sp. S365]MDT7856554.1 glycoside hydrolase family 2 TIM barrel-domain containing protein [Rubrivirga sp. S365]
MSVSPARLSPVLTTLRFRSALVAVALAFLALSDAQAQRVVTNVNADWDYLEEAHADVADALAADGWEPISLPHSWNVWDTTDIVPGYRRDASWYRRTITAPPGADRRTILYFEGAAMTADVYVDGAYAGGHVGGYVGFDVDLTDHVTPGAEHEVMVRVSNAYDPDLIPSQKADYFLFGGLTRDVWLKSVPETYIDRAHVLTPTVSAEEAEATVRVRLAGGGAADLTAAARLVDPDGRTVDTAQAPAAGGVVDLAFDTVARPALWSPDRPALYSVEVDLMRGGETIDSVTEPLGFRWFSFEPGGAFFLNGERLLLRGTHRHEEHAGYASAMPNALHRRDMEMMKEVGANFVRLGHYPQDPVVYQAADSLGIILWDELPWNRGGAGGAAWQANTERLLREQIDQNLNHPSILFWSLGNEIYWLPDVPGGDDPDLLRATVEHLDSVAHALDPSRMTAMRKYYDGDDLVDVFSPSIWAGWYSGVYTKYAEAIEEAQAEYPRLLHMEYGGSSHVGRHTETPIDGEGLVDPDEFSEAVNQVAVANIAQNGDWSENYIVDLFDWHLRVSETMPTFSGNAQWAFKDFGTPLRPENDLPFVNQKGLVDRAGRPKDAYYVFKSYWTSAAEGDDPFCYIESPTWTERTGPAGEPRETSVYCNTDAAHLYLNGESLGMHEKDIAAFPASGLSWQVPFVEGPNELVAVGFVGGAEVTRDSLAVSYATTPPGTASDLVLSTAPLANGNVLVVATMLDAEGRRVLDYEEPVYFSHDGDGEILVDWGTPTRSQRVSMANGRAAIEFVPTTGGRAVVSVLNQDFKGTYLVVPAPEATSSRRP